MRTIEPTGSKFGEIQYVHITVHVKIKRAVSPRPANQKRNIQIRQLSAVKRRIIRFDRMDKRYRAAFLSRAPPPRQWLSFAEHWRW